jgi:hypothetical protein
MITGRKDTKRVVSALLTALFLAQQTMFVSVAATEITGVRGNNGVYDITPTALARKGDGSPSTVGYRKYTDFQLSKDDIANLIFKYGKNNVETFVNLVDNKIQIDGLVNSVRDGNFYNGKAIFVSPNGMVVGASGVLNVGSLGIYTPTQKVYNDYLSNPREDLSNLTSSNGGAPVQINGKVMTAQDIDILAGKVDITGKMISGTGNTAVITGRQQAENLFNQLVNTGNVHAAYGLGNVNITSSVGTNVAKDAVITNYGNGNVNITNSGVEGIKVIGEVTNKGGNTGIVNTGNDGIKIATSGRVNASNDILLDDNSASGISIKGLSNSGNDTKIKANGGDVVIGDELNSGNNNFVTAGNNINIDVTN